MMWHFWLHPLRGIAAICVVFLHCYWTWLFYDAALMRKLYLVVDFFFVLSGFVISSGYSRRISSGIGLLLFLRHRLRRLSFHYYLSGLAWFVAAGLFVSSGADGFDSAVRLFRYVSFIDVFFTTTSAHINPVSWSVMAEFWVYVLFALVNLLFGSLRARIILFTLTGLTGFLTMGYVLSDLNVLYGWGAFLRALTGFSVGACCWLVIFGLDRPKVCLTGLAALVLAAVTLIVYGATGDMLAIPLSAIIVILFSRISPPNNRAWVSLLRWLGDISYPLYLWHFIFSVIMAKLILRYASGEMIVFHGEKFIVIPRLSGLGLCFLLVVVSVCWSWLAMWCEARLWSSLAQFRTKNPLPSRQQ